MKYILRKEVIVRVWTTCKEKAIIERNFKWFIEKNIRFTETINSNKEFSRLQKYKFEAFIVGSDQVWRPKYSPCITNYFLDFLDGNHSVKKIAYAASFGVADWEFTPKQTQSCAKLAKQFDAVSVREDSAVELCNKYLRVDACHLLDPTMLLTKEDYIRLINQENIPTKENILFSYILNESGMKTYMIQETAKKLNLNIVSGMPANSFHLKTSKKDLSDCVFPSIAEWLAGFRDAEFVVTDSFHGVVFSIIFNKPFFAIGNEQRGMDRFISLLKLFKLESRLITKSVTEPSYELDFSIFNEILIKEKDKSLKYLHNTLDNQL
jgi:polysaccharide pyruvyl transferase WcaK-like protein